MPNAAARPVPCWIAARMIVSVRAPQLPGPSSVPSSRIVVHGFVLAGFASASDARVGLERRHLARPEPLDERPLPGVLRHPLRQRHDHVGEQHAAPVAGRAARLLVCEDVLEHAVAADGQVAGGDVRSGGQRHERRRARPPSRRARRRRPRRAEGRAARGRPRARRRPAAGRRPRAARGPRRRGGDEQDGREPEQDEAASSCAEIELASPGHEHREEAGRKPAACR